VLTDQQKKFCDEYLIDLNATQAAIRAGYSPKTADRQGGRLLKHAWARARIDAALAEQSRRTGINADRALRELAKIGFANPADAVNFIDATMRAGASRDDTAAVQSIKVKTIPTTDGVGIEREIKFYDKIKALELIGKRFGLFTDKVEHSGSIDTGPSELQELLNELKK